MPHDNRREPGRADVTITPGTAGSFDRARGGSYLGATARIAGRVRKDANRSRNLDTST